MSFKVLETIANQLKSEYSENVAWADSQFNWIRCLPPGSKGVLGRNLASGLLQSYGYTPSVRQYSLRVNGQGVIVRTSLMWDADLIKFQNIRDTTFDFAMCLGIYPDQAFGWLVPKGELWVDGLIRTDRPGVTAQHKGADAWLSVMPSQVSSWLRPYGGTIDEMFKVAQKSI